MQAEKRTTQDLEPFQDFLQSPEGKRLFTNKHSGDWFIRTYRKELTKAGVLVKFLGKHHIIKPDFESALVKLLRERSIQAIDHELEGEHGR